LSTFEFDAVSQIDGVDTDFYDYLTYRRLVYIENIAYMMIVGISETNDGIKKQKHIVCNSLECELVYKKISVFSGTYKFYDTIDPSGTLLDVVMSYLPGWTIGTIDPALNILYRSFDISDTTIYNFLMDNVSPAYLCIFLFDTINKTISATTVANATTATDIFLSHDNVIKNITIDEKTDELVTSLNVYGGGDLSINQVNPLGTNSIYNFDYYTTSGSWMSQELVDAIIHWENQVAAVQLSYADLLTELKGHNNALVIYNAQVTELQGQLDALNGVRSVKIQQKLPLTEINELIAFKQTEIDAMNVFIATEQSNVDNVTELLTEINTLVSFTTNFTPEQIVELSPFIIGNTYQNENFIQTDIMTLGEIQDMAQELYDQAVTVLAKVSQPRYEFSVESTNFLFLQEFQPFIDQLVLGATVTLELKPGIVYSPDLTRDQINANEKGTYIYPALLGFTINYDDPTQFSIIFSNRLRLDNSAFTYSDLNNQTNQTNLNTNFNSEQWGSWTKNYKDSVSTFITSALDTTLNKVVSGSAQNVIFDQNGIRVRAISSGSSFDPKQLWINNGILAFTKDNWQTASLALGEVTTAFGTSYGLIADTIVGRLIASNELVVTNSSNNFTVDASGATLTNATLNINSTSGNSRIFLDPVNGIKIQANVGGTWTDKFFVDNGGNLTFTGNLTGATGTFSGAINAATITGGTITGTSINGGSISGTTGTFSGNIYAANLQGYVSAPQIGSVYGSSLTSGGTINNNTIAWSGGRIYASGNTGYIWFNGICNIFGNYGGASSQLALGGSASLFGNTSVLISSNGSISLQGSSTSNSGNFTVSGTVTSTSGLISNYVSASQYIAGGSYGIDVVVNPYNTNTGRWRFVKGILVSTNY
jgi:hypothetical protein